MWRGTIKQLKDTVELTAPMYQVFFQLAPPLQEVTFVLAIGTPAIGYRVPVEPPVMAILCELLNTRKELIANPAGPIDILLGMESCGLLLKTQPLERTPFMRDLSVSRSPLSSLYTIKGAIGGIENDGPSNCVYSTKTYTKSEPHLSRIHSTAIAFATKAKLPQGMEPIDILLKQARLWIIDAGYDPSDNRIEYTSDLPRPPPLSCKAVADFFTTRQRHDDEDDEDLGFDR